MNQLKVVSPFNAAHLYHQPKWSEEKNRAEFGRCFSEHGHGHNYRLEVTFEDAHAFDDAQILKLKSLVDGVADQLDHQHLNFTIPEFKTQIPTTENIALWLSSRIRAQAPNVRTVRLYEMDSLFAEIHHE